MSRIKLYPGKDRVKKPEGIVLNEYILPTIQCIDQGKTKEETIGVVLQGSDDVESFNEIWNAILDLSIQLRTVPVDPFPTSGLYQNYLKDQIRVSVSGLLSEDAKVDRNTDFASFFDENRWVSGLMEENNVTTWTGLQNSL